MTVDGLEVHLSKPMLQDVHHSLQLTVAAVSCSSNATWIAVNELVARRLWSACRCVRSACSWCNAPVIPARRDDLLMTWDDSARLSAVIAHNCSLARSFLTSCGGRRTCTPDFNTDSASASWLIAQRRRLLSHIHGLSSVSVCCDFCGF